MAGGDHRADVPIESSIGVAVSWKHRVTRRRLLPTVLVLVVVAAVGVALSIDREPDGGLLGQPVESFTHVHGLAFPGWSDHLFLSTHRGLIVIDDETGTWRYASDEAHDLMGFRAHPSEEGVLYASGHPAPGSGLANPVGFLVSRDRGRSWEPLSLLGIADFHAMAVDHSDGRVVYGWNVGRDPGLYRSDDGGRSWQRLDAAELWEAGGVFALAVDPADPHRVMAGTETGLLESTDAGQSWEVALGGSPVTAVEWVRAERMLAYVAVPQMGLVASTDDGGSWARMGLELSEDAVVHLAAHPTDAETLYLGTVGEALLRTRDGGESWELLAEAGVPLDPREQVTTGS